MFSRIGISMASGLLAAVLMTGGQIDAANDNIPEGGEVQGRGPIHEAFAQPLEEGQAQAGPVAPKAPPEPIEEQVPEKRPEGDGVQWVPGYWQWDDERGEFLWVSGLWRNPPPNRKWVPGSWRESNKGFEYSNGFWTPESSQGLQYLPPPPATVEEGPSVAAPGDDYSYVPGLWVYRDTHYVWRPGYWLRYRPNWIWQPAHYVYTPAGYLYAAGCWDYPLETRGILFAPVCFSAGYYPRVWSPRFAVSIDCLSGALFVRGGHRHYYYGDYFAAGYRRGGYTPWVDVTIGRHSYDPLYGHYRTAHAGRTWERDVRGLYADRFAGRADRPPRTLVQQNIVTRNVTNATTIKNITVLRPLAQSAPARTQLVTVDRTERDHQRQRATELRTAGVQRVKTERELIVRKEAPSRTLATPKTVTLDLPKTTRSSQQFERHTQPGQRIEGPKSQPKIEHHTQPAQRIEVPKSQPKIERHTQPPQRIEVPKSQPKIERHSNEMRIEKPKTTPHVEKVIPRHETPKVTPRFESPKSAPRIETPKVAPRFEMSKPAPRFDPSPRHSPPQHAAPSKPSQHSSSASSKAANHNSKPKK